MYFIQDPLSCYDEYYLQIISHESLIPLPDAYLSLMNLIYITLEVEVTGLGTVDPQVDRRICADALWPLCIVNESNEQLE